MTGHPPDDVLEILALEPDSDVPAEMREHVASCTRCRAEISALMGFCCELAKQETWELMVDLGPAPTPPEALAHAVETLRLEDEVAAFLLEPVLSEAESLRDSLMSDTRYRTVGVVRRLVSASESTREESPLKAMFIADAAVIAAEGMDPERYDAELLQVTRGAAWRERANVLRYLGRHAEALAATERAEEAFRKTRLAELDLARLNFIRATVLHAMQRHDEALPPARAAVEVFRDYGDTVRQVHAGLVEGAILFELHQPALAVECFRKLLAPAEEADDARTLGFLYNALGAALQDSGDPVQAAEFFRKALALYEHLGMDVERLRTSWSLALLAIDRGETARGMVMLTKARSGFESRGCIGEAALVSLDLAEQHAVAGRPEQVIEACRELVDRFKETGMMHSALVALSYLRDAAAAQRATPVAIQHVRRFIRQLAHEPSLLFAPPPER